MSVNERTLRDGSEAIVIDAVREGQVRARDLGDAVEIAAMAAPGTFPVYVQLTPEAARSLGEWLLWYAEQEAPR